MFHPLARMDGVMRAMTVALLVVPAVLFGAAFLEAPAATVVSGTGVFVGLIYGGVFFFARPRGFAVHPGRVDVVFPAWTRSIDGVLKAERVTSAELKQRYGMLLRVGAGGLWGGFGWLWSRRGWLEFYVSRLDGYVLLSRSEGLPLLISPEDPDKVCEQVRGS